MCLPFIDLYKVRLAYQDDRKAKAERDEREAALRIIRAANPPKEAPVRRPGKMPSVGMTVSGQEVVTTSSKATVADDDDDMDDDSDDSEEK